ncbi:MAG TPA: hypothetical protein VKD22_14270 [Ramlibacter sp.]|nr:hypothetical protein [Ramlibacter sp.]
MQARGRIEVITGPTFSGKSTELMRRMRTYTHAGERVFIIKPVIDDRYAADSVVSHDGASIAARAAITLHVTIPDDVTVVGVDEGQFFPELAQVCETWAARGLIVVVAGLDSYATREPWSAVCSLLPCAERIDKLHAVCKRCKRPAAFTYSHSRDRSSHIQIGGAETYEAMCRQCHAQATAAARPSYSPEAGTEAV